ncbi:MAG: RNA methyltransferase, partial [Calditrichia bacterium]|nr:RNA methyltransferase [Calditrichia bacterium]
LPKMEKKNDTLFLYLDRIQDPQNFGALLRSAELMGVDAVFYPVKESTPVTSVVIKASMGAALLLPLIAIKTPFNFLEIIRQKGLSIIGTLKEKDKSISLPKYNFASNNCLIIGNEETGIKNSLRKLCDAFVYIPQVGRTDSFNASVAGGIILYEIARQKAEK